ncbi:MAG: type II CAAX prenyl endopeptidase Rce1 family protein [Ruminococcus callidus]
MTNEPYTEETAGQIDPQNPFENALENAAYRTDYRRFLPQILLPDFHIPLFPEREERSRIRRQMNTAGAGALLGCMGSQLLFPLTIMVLLLCMDGTAASYFNGDQSGAIHTMESSGIYMALHCLIFGGMNTLVAWLGCRRIRQPLGGLFRTTDFSGWKAFQYICIGFALQQLSVVLYAVTKLLHLELPEVSFDYFQSTQSMLLALLYTCVLAPVTEELLFRGFLMKSLSAVSVRFGIVTSALLFGLMHGNFQQGILGLLMGLFLGKIVIRHNSLTPSILAHIALNTSSTLSAYCWHCCRKTSGTWRFCRWNSWCWRWRSWALRSGSGKSARNPAVSHPETGDPKPCVLVVAAAPAGICRTAGADGVSCNGGVIISVPTPSPQLLRSSRPPL